MNSIRLKTFCIFSIVPFLFACDKIKETFGTVGKDGQSGEKGEKGAPGIGTWKGVWNSSTPYSLNDIVQYNGSSYFAVSVNSNNPPPSSSWELVTQKGDTGANGSTGVTGATGPSGTMGATGATGATGTTGATGAAGSNGTNGKTVLNGSGAPGDGTGVDGDFYIDTSNSRIYGPKASGVWSGYISLIGPTGPTGSTGATGSTGSTGAKGASGTVGARTTRANVARNVTDATKTAQCVSEFGSNFEAGLYEEISFYFNGLPYYLTVATDTTSVAIEEYTKTCGSIYVPRIGTTTSAASAPIFCVANDAHFRVTSATVAASASDAAKDAACVAEFGSNYIAGNLNDIGLGNKMGSAFAINLAGTTDSLIWRAESPWCHNRPHYITAAVYRLLCVRKD